MPEWAALFDNYGIKTVSRNDREKNAYVLTASQRFAMSAAGLEPSFGEDKAVYTVEVLFDPAVRSMQISYYNSERAGSGRSPEPRVGRGLLRWIDVGDELVIANVGNRVFVAKGPIPPVGQDFLATEDGARLTDEKGDYITVPVSPDVSGLADDLENGRPTLIGSPAELQMRRQLLDRIGELERELEQLRPGHGGIGHNNPPADEDDPDPELIDFVAESAGILRTELTKEAPDALQVARAGIALRNAGHWLAGKGDAFADEFVRALGKSLGGASGKAVILVALLEALPVDVAAWLQAITWPF
jgi:hypothetical protein